MTATVTTLFATKLREAADRLTPQIEAKRNSRSGQYTHMTHRRASMAASQAQQADRLERIQGVMHGLADAHEAGAVPPCARRITNRAQIETILGHKDFPEPIVHKSLLRDVLDASKGRRYTKGPHETIERVHRYRESPNDWGLTLYGSEEVAALETLCAVCKALPRTGPTWHAVNSAERVLELLAPHKRVAAIGIDRDNYAEVRAFLELLAASNRAAPDPLAKARELERGIIGLQIPGYFPTPRDLAARLVEEADIRHGHIVLELSAGNGNIAEAVRDAWGGDVTLLTIECSIDLRPILEAKGFTLAGDDFLTFKGKADRIVMNPPFEGGQDIDHVQHAYWCLRPGGRVVAIVGESSMTTNSSRKAIEWRAWLDALNAYRERLPDGSFKSSQRPTGVATWLVVLDREREG